MFKWLTVISLFFSSLISADTLYVDSVTDGDTVRGTINGQSYRIRLQCIDAPEIRQDYGSQARNQLSRLIGNGRVEFEQDDVDRYGRLLGYIYVNGRNINREMVSRGAAWNYEYYCGNRFAREMRSAYRARRGLWSRSNPISPYCFRQGRNNQSCYYDGE